MKLVLALCSLSLIGATVVFFVQQKEPTRVRVPAGVARTLELSPEAEIDPLPLESPSRVAANTVIEHVGSVDPDPDEGPEPRTDREPLTDEVAAVLRDRGLEVEVPAMVLYSGVQLNEALRCFEDGMQELVASHSDARRVDEAIAARRELGWSDEEIENDVSEWSLTSIAHLAVAANLGRIAEALRESIASGRAVGPGQVRLRAGLREPIHPDALSSATTFSDGDPTFTVQFQKRQWHFALTIPYAFLGEGEREAMRAALARRDRAIDAVAAWRERRASGAAGADTEDGR